jgi:hypothetical protein
METHGKISNYVGLKGLNVHISSTQTWSTDLHFKFHIVLFYICVIFSFLYLFKIQSLFIILEGYYFIWQLASVFTDCCMWQQTA